MTHTRVFVAVAGIALVVGARPATAQIAAASSAASATTRADRAAVNRAVLDYVEGFYEGDSTKHVRSIHPDVKKYGFARDRTSGAYQGSAMAWEQFHAFTRRVREQNRQTPATAPKGIDIYDVQDQTAVAKLTASWGTDYLTLAKYDGKWMVVHVLWQTPMPTR
jgi:hypothetical protein